MNNLKINIKKFKKKKNGKKKEKKLNIMINLIRETKIKKNYGKEPKKN